MRAFAIIEIDGETCDPSLDIAASSDDKFIRKFATAELISFLAAGIAP